MLLRIAAILGIVFSSVVAGHQPIQHLPPSEKSQLSIHDSISVVRKKKSKKKISDKKYVTSRIHAQLGNQLFQVAAAIAYARDHGCEARFPELQESIRKDPNYQFLFHRVDISPFPSEVQFIRFHESITRVYSPIPFTEGNYYLDGYFQSDKYFYNHSDYIKSLFAPTDTIVQQIKKKYGSLLEQPTVAVHLRTFISDGNNPEVKENWGEFSWNYFITAMECFSEDFLFLIFSDNIEWVKTHFPPIRRNCVFIENNPNYFDLYFMSLCQHQIVSPRSSFSWWAAYLNPNPDKVVIVPQNWTTNVDGVPENWIRLDYPD